MRLRIGALFSFGFALAILGSWVNVAHAAPGELDVTCTVPTTNTDGSALTNLVGFRFYGTTTSADPALLGSTTVAQGCHFVKALPPGNWAVTVSAYTASAESAKTSFIFVNIPDQDGDGISDPLDKCPTVKGDGKDGCPLVPNPPTNVVGKMLTAYEYRPSTNSMASIGIVQPGTVCTSEIKTLSGKTYSAIPFDPKTVDYYNSPQNRNPPLKVWALCEAPISAG